MNPDSFPLAGEAACLGAAALWALAVTWFRPAIESHGAQTVNLAKCALAALLQILTIVALDGPGALVAIPAAALGWISLSSLAGLIVGDTALFGAVKSIGVHRTLLLQTLTPAFATLFSWLVLGELPTSGQGVGVVIILAGIGLVVAPRAGEPRGWALAGGGLALLAAVGQGVGLVTAKVGMEGLPVLTATALRLTVAALALATMLAVRGRLGRLWSLGRHANFVRRVLPATVLGTYLAMFLYMLGAKLIVAPVAAVLIGTSPIFSLLIEWAATGRAPGWRALAGTLLAVAGVAVLSGTGPG